MHLFFELAHRWRAAAGEWRDAAQNGGPAGIRAVYEEMSSVIESCANELDATVEERQNEELTIQQAAEQSLLFTDLCGDTRFIPAKDIGYSSIMEAPLNDLYCEHSDD